MERTIDMAGASAREQEYLRLLAEHGAAIRRLAMSCERDPGKREDLEQDICIALWQALPRFRGESSTRTFVFRIAHNRMVTHIQRHHRHASEPLADDPPQPDGGDDPENAAARQQRREQLRTALQQLPLGQRQVVLLTLEGLSHREIGDVLGLSETNVAVRLTRAKSALRSLMTAGRGTR
jgi:RNA polymerase sigma-70 factor (ECF subfamily)